ncbi:MAG: DUF447 family protein [Metallosphaera sp.]
MITSNINVFPHKGIYEVLLGTSGISDNVSPIGLRFFDDIRVRLYPGSMTLRNITLYPYCSIHISQDPTLFYLGLSGKLKGSSVSYGLPIVDAINCILIAKCSQISLGVPSEFSLIFIEELGSCTERALSRGDGLFIDLLVHITRIDLLPEIEAKKLLDIIKYEIGVINRTSPHLSEYVNEISESLKSKGYKLD